MRTRSFLCILIGLGFFSLIFLAPISVHAALYSTDLGFETSNQNMWGGGSSVTLADETFVGFEWDEYFYLGGYVGGIETLIPAGCFIWCWDAVLIDTTTGGHLAGDTDGKVGIEFGYSIDSGSVNASYPVNVELTYPDPDTVSPGETFTISSQYVAGPSAGFDTNFPEIQAYADLIFDVYAHVNAGVEVLGVGDAIDQTLIDANYTQEIIGFNRDGNGQLSFLGIDTGVVGSEIELNPYVDITVTIPDIETTSTETAPDTYVSAGETDFLAMGLDVDQIATDIISKALNAMALPGIPPLSADLFGILSYDIFDIDMGAQLDILQSFLFEPELMISLETSYGNEYMFAAGDSIDLVMGDSIFDITPTYTLNNTFTNATALDIDPTMWLQALEASAFGFSIGPLWEKTLVADIFPVIPVYENSFSLGFDPYTTASFSIAPAEPVPEPATMLLLGSGLIGLAVFGRRKKQKIN